MAQATDHPLVSKYKAISTLIPYAVLQERDGRPEMLDTFLHVARASQEKGYKWLYVKYIITTLIFKASPRAVVLALPHFQWNRVPVGEWNDLVAVWARSTSVVPYTEEVCQSVVDMLLQFGSEETSNPSGV